MNLTPEQCYEAMLTHDARFDGRFFVGVKTTGIYCRPICSVRTPFFKNCRFFPFAVAAEAAGFRPCLRCRPELAPGNSPMEASSNLAHAAMAEINQGFLIENSLDDLAAKMGVTARQMRRVFQDEFGAPPVAIWQTQRLFLAKQLLADTSLPVTEVALASGFRSIRRFNTTLKANYRLTPTQFRKVRTGQNHQSASDEVTFRLGYFAPFAWDHLLAFLGARAIPGVECVHKNRYTRTVQILHEKKLINGWVEVSNLTAKNTILLRLSDSLIPVCFIVKGKIQRLFDLGADPVVITQTLGPLAADLPGLRVPGAFDGFEMAVRAVLGQLVSVAGARTFAGRLADKFGTPLTTPVGSLNKVFPTAGCLAKLSIESIQAIGLTRKRAETISALARAVHEGVLILEPGHRLHGTLKLLRSLPGIGEWTAQYIAMRVLAWPDAFPHLDLGIRKAMGNASPKQILEVAEKWRPWRAYAALHLWNQLSNKTKTQTL